jgi:PiT family inorganic phosphate transporter
VGVPVSTSQAIVGGVTGVGLVKGLRTVRKKTLVGIVVGWVSTPLLCGVISYLMMKLYLSFSGVGA